MRYWALRSIKGFEIVFDHYEEPKLSTEERNELLQLAEKLFGVNPSRNPVVTRLYFFPRERLELGNQPCNPFVVRLNRTGDAVLVDFNLSTGRLRVAVKDTTGYDGQWKNGRGLLKLLKRQTGQNQKG